MTNDLYTSQFYLFILLR